MHSLVIGIAALLVGAWLLFLPLRLAIQLRRVLRERASAAPVSARDGVENS